MFQRLLCGSDVTEGMLPPKGGAGDIAHFPRAYLNKEIICKRPHAHGMEAVRYYMESCTIICQVLYIWSYSPLEAMLCTCGIQRFVKIFLFIWFAWNETEKYLWVPYYISIPNRAIIWQFAQTEWLCVNHCGNNSHRKWSSRLNFGHATYVQYTQW